MHNPNSYPLQAFPSELRDIIIALHEDTQFPVEMIGSTLLAALSLALQSLVEVASPYTTDGMEPCSLYFLTLAESGEGKGPVFDKIMSPFNVFFFEMQKEYEELYDRHRKDYAAWSSVKKGLESSLRKSSRNGGDNETEMLLFREHLDKEPYPPRKFELFNDDCTPVGLIEQLNRYPYAGCFTSEAMTFFNGYLKNNQALLNKLWSNEPYMYNRKNKSIHLTGCRLTALLMTQPSEFEKYLQTNGVRGILNGFLARFLITKTYSTKENRKINLNQEMSDKELSILHGYLNGLFERQKCRFHDNTIPLELIELDAEAKILFKERVEQFNYYASGHGKWEHISEFISKAGSQAIRIAAIFGYYNHSISKADLNNAFTITEWHLNQAAEYFYESSEQFQLKQDVYMLFDWIKKHFEKPKGSVRIVNNLGQQVENAILPYQPFLKNDLETSGPARLRRKERLMPALKQLIGLGLIVPISYYRSGPVYIGMACYDNNHNAYVVYPTIPNTLILETKNNTEKVLEGYDITRLQW